MAEFGKTLTDLSETWRKGARVLVFACLGALSSTVAIGVCLTLANMISLLLSPDRHGPMMDDPIMAWTMAGAIILFVPIGVGAFSKYARKARAV